VRVLEQDDDAPRVLTSDQLPKNNKEIAPLQPTAKVLQETRRRARGKGRADRASKAATLNLWKICSRTKRRRVTLGAHIAVSDVDVIDLPRGSSGS